jgi:3-hydroxyacyl-CoA dehydrogenase
MKINDVADYAVEDRIAVITVDSPPVNALSAAVRSGFLGGLELALADPDVDAIVMMCGGRTFVAGADITEFGKPPKSPRLNDLLDGMENSPKPVIAAIHGQALGGGLELALVAHYRVAVPSAKAGLPEVKLGLLPGAGGTQRLPRVVGVEKALEMIAIGDPISAQAALDIGLFDALAPEGDLRGGAVKFARQVLAEGRPLVRVRDQEDKLQSARANPGLFDAFRAANARKFRGFHAPENIIKALEAAATLPFEAGMAREWALFSELLADSQSAAMRHVFFAERQAAKVDGIPADIATAPIRKVGIVGAGTMGGGIAMNFLNAGIPVAMVEMKPEALERGLGVIRGNYEATARKGRLKPEQVEQRMGLLSGGLDLAGLSDCDLIIEAVFEQLDIKQQVFAALDKVARPDAILATNTSYLSVDAIAGATTRPGRVLGLHFFSPANVMRQLEVVRGPRTEPAVLATAMKLAKTIGKVAVVSGDSFGFIGNRMLAARHRQADQLILDGATPSDVDRVLTDFGFPMGHFAMRDLAGLDIGWDAARTSSSDVREILNEMGRHGQKSGAGFYDYDAARNATASPVVEQVIRDFAVRAGVPQRRVSDAEISERCLLSMVNEGAKVLEEGVSARPSDIDVVWVTGYGWPVYRGGPMFWADLSGTADLLARLKALQALHGDAFKPAALIETLAAEGRSFNDYQTGKGAG